MLVLPRGGMALTIESSEADRLARELTDVTGETVTDAVVNSLRERLDRERRRRDEEEFFDRVRRIQSEVKALRILDDRPADEILGYDEHGLPR